MKKQNELEVGLELIKKNIPVLQDGWTTACHSFNAFNIVTFLFGSAEGSNYVREFGPGYKSATAELFETAYFLNETRKNTEYPDGRIAILDIIPVRNATTGLLLRAKTDNPLLFNNYMDMKLGDGATLGLFTYNKQELERDGYNMLYHEIKHYMNNPEDILAIPMDEKVYRSIGDFRSLMSTIEDSSEFKNVMNGCNIIDISDIKDLLAIILAFYVDNFFNYMISIEELSTRVVPNQENRNYYSSGITVVEVEDPLFKEKCPEVYTILNKYKSFLMSAPEIIDLIMEKIFSTLFQLYVVNFIYMLQVSSDNEDNFIDLDDLGFYTLCKHFRIQMGVQALTKPGLMYNLDYYSKTDDLSNDSNKNATKLTSDSYLNKDDKFDKKLRSILEEVSRNLDLDIEDDDIDDMPRFLN